MGGAKGDAFYQRTVHVAAFMCQVQPEEGPFGKRVVYWGPLAGKIGQEQQTIRARGHLCGLVGQRGECGFTGQVAGKLITKPMGQGAGCCQPRHRSMLSGKEPGRIPKARISHAFLRYRDHEDGRAIHHHHVAGLPHPHAERFCRGIDRARGHRGANSQAGRLGRVGRHMPGNVRRPKQARQHFRSGDVRCKIKTPILGLNIVDRREIGSGIVIDDVFAGQAVHQKAGGRQDFGGPRIKPGPLLFEPKDLWAHRLGCQRIAASVENDIGTDLFGQGIDLRHGAGIDAIKDAVHQGCAVCIHRQHTRTNRGTGDRPDIFRPATGCRNQLSGDHDKIAPPILFRPVFGPTGARHFHLVRIARRGDNVAGRVYQDPLGFKGSDVDAQCVTHHQRSSEKSGLMPFNPANSNLDRSSRSLSWHTSSDEWL